MEQPSEFAHAHLNEKGEEWYHDAPTCDFVLNKPTPDKAKVEVSPSPAAVAPTIEEPLTEDKA